MWKSKLRKLITIGKLEVVTSGGTSVSLGGEDYAGRHRKLDVKVRLNGGLTPLKLAVDPYRYLGEAYMNGDLVIERGDLWDLMELIGYNFEDAGPERPGLLARWGNEALRLLQQRNGIVTSRRNVSHHYDLSEDLYRLFLDRDMQYSCAYFRSPGDTLEDAQLAKKEHIAAKLLLEPGMQVLDIGCGWGGMALFLAERYQVRGARHHPVEGTARGGHRAGQGQGAAGSGLLRADRLPQPDAELRPHRLGRHVRARRRAQLPDLFRQRSRRCSIRTGVALIHSIGRMRGPSRTSGFIRRYIFPGGYIPAVSEVMPAIERSGLWLTDLEILRLHYAETLRHWRERFMAARDRLPPQYDERFQRMWEFYLASSEASFRFHGFMVFQAQLFPPRPTRSRSHATTCSTTSR